MLEDEIVVTFGQVEGVDAIMQRRLQVVGVGVVFTVVGRVGEHLLQQGDELGAGENLPIVARAHIHDVYEDAVAVPDDIHYQRAVGVAAGAVKGSFAHGCLLMAAGSGCS